MNSLVGILEKNFVERMYEASSSEDRKSLETFARAHGVNVSVYTLATKLFVKTAELGNRLVDVLSGDSLEDSGSRPILQIVDVDVDTSTKEPVSQNEVESLLHKIKKVIADRNIDDTDNSIPLYRQAVKTLSKMSLRINGDTLFSNFPREIGLARLVLTFLGETTKLSALKKFEALGIVTIENINLGKVKDSERIAKAVAADVEIDILAGLKNKTPILVIDVSGSMEPAISMLKWLEKKLTGQKAYYVVLFGDGQITVYEKSQNHDIETRAEGNTPLFPSIDVALQIAEREKDNDPVIILISDFQNTALWSDRVVVRSTNEQHYKKAKPETSFPIIGVYSEGWSTTHWDKEALIQYHKDVNILALPRKFSEYDFLSKLYSALNRTTKIEYWVEDNTLYIRKV